MSRPNGLTEQQRAFVKNLSMGMLQGQAARNAGFKFPDVEAGRLLKNPKIIDAVNLEQSKFEKASDMSRKKVIDGLLEAIDVGRTMSDPTAMVAGWREIAKICGYNAPETKRIEFNVTGAVRLSEIEDLSDEDLMKLIIEGESVRLPDGQALLEGPDGE